MAFLTLGIPMKNLLLPAVTLALTAGCALAADLPSRKAEALIPPPAPPMWTGFYAGLNAGYNFGTNGNAVSENYPAPIPFGPFGTLFDPTPSSMSGSGSHSQNGFLGGLQIGYNYQWGNALIGLETDIQGSGARGSSLIRPSAATQLGALGVNFNIASNGATEVNAGLDYLGAVRGRFGYLFTPTLLIYGTGGFAYGGAYARVNQTAIEYAVVTQNIIPPQYSSFVLVADGRQSQLLTGWTAGGGLEWMIMPNWSLKAEALYWDLGRLNIPSARYASLSVPGLYNTSVSYSGVAARAGLNYHFNWGGLASLLANQ
jgi:outer membrane immunogenic protein